MKIIITVKPNSKCQTVEEIEEGIYKIKLKSPPTQEKANNELIEVLANYFTVPKKNIKIKLGHYTRQKVVEIV